MSLYDELMDMDPIPLSWGIAVSLGGALEIAKKHDAEIAQLRHAALVLKQACKTAIAQLKGREHDEFLRLAIAAADAAGIKS